MREIVVRSWNELNDCLFESSWREPLGRFRSPYVYRGVSRAEYELLTGLARLGGDPDFLEEHILRAFRRYAHHPDIHASSIWNWLALAQHHGLPTRLLDWTYSPFVAAHFATCRLEHHDRDGAIWCIDFDRINEALPARLREELDQRGGFVFSADMLDESAPALAQFDALSDDTFMLFFEPPSIDERIVNQYALFSLLSNPAISLSRWLDEHPDVVHRIILPSDFKLEVRDKLDQANITERVLHPGLDGLSAWLRRYYTPSRTIRRSAGRLSSRVDEGAGEADTEVQREGDDAKYLAVDTPTT
ncbi:MAG: FRG domain-containing protein [Chloroflexota bacterium]|nr:MAG: FRG domain-containing protein [Chloroflexota bacterium]